MLGYSLHAVACHRALAIGCIILAALLPACSALPAAGPQPSTSAPLHLRAIAGTDRAIHLAIDPADRGSNHVAVWLTNNQNQVLTTASSVEVRWSMLEQPTVLPAAQPVRQADGYWTLARVPLDSAGWWKVDLRFELPGQPPANAQFFLVIPDPTQVRPPPDHPADPHALAVFQAALARIEQLTSMQAEEKLTDGIGDTLDTHFAYTAPDKSTATTSSHYRSVSIGSTRYDREPGGEWTLSQRVNPFAFPADFPTYYAKAAGQTLGIQEELDGERCQIITFHTPASGLWYAWWVGTGTHLLRREAMVADHHYMITHFTGFDQPVQITVPAVATPASSAARHS
jgi:hypothetical protein